MQWQVSADGGTSWSDISGATSTTYSFTTTIPPSENGYEYEAVFTNSSGSATTNAATLTFTGPPSAPPTITSQPVSVTVTAGYDRLVQRGGVRVADANRAMAGLRRRRNIVVRHLRSDLDDLLVHHDDPAQ